jgi:hypothetical protein
MTIKYISFKKGTPADGYWDQAFIQDILSDPIFKNNDDPTGGIFILPGPYNGDYVDNLNEFLAPYEWVILFITSDEESKFPVEKIHHKNIKIWVQYPKVGRHKDYRWLPLGYTTETRKNLGLYEKDIDIFYSGQRTHTRRELCADALEKIKDKYSGLYYNTEGFTQGLDQPKYIEAMCRAKIAPAPSGNVSQESFRLYEALESGAVPIADDVAPDGSSGYWLKMFPNIPFPVLRDYDDLAGYIEDSFDNYQEKANQYLAWWIREKQELKREIILDYKELTGKEAKPLVTVLIPVSYIPSHPDVKILRETIQSVRYHLPEAEIVLTFDGLREEHKDHKKEYEEFIRRVLFYANTEWGKCYPLIFPKHVHQIGMAREALKYIDTPLLLYVEQDTPLVTDEPIDWQLLQGNILYGTSYVIRFHFEGVIPDAHKHLMLGKPENQLLKTIQWSQRPHLASTAFYRRIVDQYFTPDAKCFLEDVLHGKLIEDYTKDGMQGWNQWRVHIYFPNEKNIKRSLNLDGRAGSPKYDDTQTW